MPGVLIIEAMAQVGGLLMLDTIENPEEQGRLLHVARQREVAPAGDSRGPDPLRGRGAADSRRHLPDARALARVDGQVVAEAEMMARVVDR